MKILTLALVGIGLLVACSDSSNGPTGGSGPSGGAAAGGADQGTGGSGATTEEGGNGNLGGFSGGAITITMDSFDVGPGQEVYKCQNFANPFGGDGEVSAFESHMTEGSHHLLLFYEDGATDSALEDCSGLEFAPTPYSTQLPDDALTYPDGVSALVPAAKGFRLQSHYLNPTNETITAHVEVTLHTVDPGVETQHAGVLFVVEPNFVIAPHSTQTVTHDCSIPFDMNLLKAASHMHKHGTGFVATVSDETLYETTTWSDPVPVVFDPPKAVAGGSPLHFECDFQNDSDSPLVFGESAATNEMCIFVSAFYPVPSDGIVTVDCN